MLLFSIQSNARFIPFIRFMRTRKVYFACDWMSSYSKTWWSSFEKVVFFCCWSLRFTLILVYFPTLFLTLYWHNKQLEHYGHMNWTYVRPRISLFANFYRTDQKSAYFPLFHANNLMFRHNWHFSYYSFGVSWHCIIATSSTLVLDQQRNLWFSLSFRLPYHIASSTEIIIIKIIIIIIIIGQIPNVCCAYQILYK